MFRQPSQKLNRDPVTAIIATVGGGLLLGGSQVLAAKQEKKAAKATAEAQQNINQQNIKAAQNAESQAQATAKAQQKAAIARKDRIAFTPLGQTVDPGALNQPTILGVPG